MVYVLVGRKIKEVAKATHPQLIIEFTNVNIAGWHATVMRTGSEVIRKLVTDNRLSAKLGFKNVTHQLQIQPYKSGGNTYFTIAPLGPFSGNPLLVVQAVSKGSTTTTISVVGNTMMWRAILNTTYYWCDSRRHQES